MTKSLKILTLLGCIFFLQQSMASSPYKPRLADPVLEPWRWSNFPEYDTIHIACMVNDEKAGTWMGIGNKAVFYDGYRATSLIPDSTFIQSMILEKERSLLLSTQKGIFRFRNGAFQKILNGNFSAQQNFVCTTLGDVWIGSEHGLLQITPTAIFCLNPEGYFEISGNGDIRKTIRTEKANDYQANSVTHFSYPVNNLCLGSQNHLWMTMNDPDKKVAGIDIGKLQEKLPEWQFLAVPSINIYDISGICENQNSLWITSSNPNTELLQYSFAEKKWKSVNLKSLGGDNVQTSVLAASEEKMWVGGHSKLYLLESGKWTVYQYPEVVLPLSYNRIYLDKQQNLFVFGDNGSLMCLDLSIDRFCTFQGLNFNCNSADGKYWFTTNSGEVVVAESLGGSFRKFDTTDGLMDMAVSLYFSKTTGLWAGGSHHGKAAIARFQNNRWNLIPFPELYLGISYNGIRELGDSCIVFPVNGILELNNNSYQGGFVSYNFRKNAWRSYTKNLVPQRIPSIGMTSDGKLWFSGGGLYKFDGKKTEPCDLPGKAFSWVDDVAVSPTNRIWVAMGGTGLFYHDGKKWTRFTTFNELASNMVTNLLIENDSAVFVASDKGISFFDGKQFIPQIIHPDLNIPRERGFMRKSDDGSLWINMATREWYLYDFKNSAENPDIFKTTMYRRENHPPQTSISFSNKEISSAGNVIIAYQAVDYRNQTPPSKIQYSYRLNKGNWSPFSVEKSSVFLDLDAGNYTLEVRSRDLDNNIEPHPASISFAVLPPVYLRGWFILTILIFIGIIIWLLLRLYARNKQIHELDQLKLRLFTDISHELKTPLTLISLPLQKMLDKARRKQENTDSLELIYTNVQRLNNLVHQVVDFRRLEAGKIQMEPTAGDVIRHLQNIAHYYKPLAHEKNIRFIFTCNLQEAWIKYDADKLEKIVVNLLSNAFKYTPENEKVELVAEIGQGSDQIQLWVNDSGPGIPKDMQENIFDRFYRLRNEKATRIPGSGIGLSLVKELITLYNGQIEVISDGVHGTSFHVTLPVTPAEKAEPGESSPEKVTAPEKMSKAETATILLIEDEEPMLKFISEELRRYFTVKGFGSVEKAYEWLNEEMPDLIISDVMLPGMTGMDLCRKLKSEHLTSHLPVILLTARDSEEDIVEGLSAGADDYITKPFKMNELIARCYNLIENRRRLKDRFAEQDEPEFKLSAQNLADQQLLDKAFRTVYENLDNTDFDVPQFCLAMNMSKTLLYSKLKSLTGQSATEFVRNIRLKEAKKLLQNNDHQKTIAEISYQVGFNDPLYFSRCFRKYFGVPPSEVGK